VVLTTTLNAEVIPITTILTDEIVTESFTQKLAPLVNVLLDGLLGLLLDGGGHGVIPLNMANIPDPTDHGDSGVQPKNWPKYPQILIFCTMADDEQYGLQYINPTVFWVYNIGKFDFNGLEEKCQPYDENEWACILNTSRKTEYDWKPFIEHIKPFFGHKYLPHVEKNIEVRFAMPWMNIYTKGCYQESHNHLRGRTSLAYCYFHKIPKDKGAAKFGFHNEMHRLYVNTIGEMNLPDCAEWWYPDFNEGDLVIFPASLTHHVTLHKIDDERITVSGNVGLFSKSIDEVY